MPHITLTERAGVVVSGCREAAACRCEGVSDVTYLVFFEAAQTNPGRRALQNPECTMRMSGQ